jgi:bifunctional non-homologous end joining protein LigD
MPSRTQSSVRGWIEPMLATLTVDYFSDPDWIFEPKLDGIRCLTFRGSRGVEMFTRNKLPLQDAHPAIRLALEAIPHRYVVDGEIAATLGGRTSFSALQRNLLPADRRRVRVHYHVFDIMRLDGSDLRKLPVLERKAILKEAGFNGGAIKLVAHRRTHGERYLQQACAQAMEGIIAKRADSPYTSGRSKDWLKFKCSLEQEFVIAGWTDPQGSRTGFGALLVGYYDVGELRYAGKVGTGYGSGALAEMANVLKRLEIDSSPFADGPRPRSGVHWVRPELVGQVGFSEWTRDGRLRHPRFLGLRHDKSPGDVVRES